MRQILAHFMAASLPNLWKHSKNTLKKLTHPISDKTAANTISGTSKALLLENVFLRQQLAILKRQIPRPNISRRDRLKLLILAHFLPNWKNILHIVQPETLLRWHRELFKHFWKKKSKTSHHPRRISEETISLIRQMANENHLWGAEHIRGELLKLGIRVAKRTVQKYLPKDRHTPGQSWATFLKNNAQDIFVCDFTVVNDLLFRQIHLFVVMHLATRQIVHFNITRNPTRDWTAQQMREISPWNQGPKYLICDNDNKFGQTFFNTAEGIGIEVIQTPFYTPQANGHCERLIGSIKRECIDHMLILNEKQLRRVMREYSVYYNANRPHQGINQQVPDTFSESSELAIKGKNLIVTPYLNGLHHSYQWAAPPS